MTMAEYVFVTVRCAHRGQGHLSEVEAETIRRMRVTPGREPRGLTLEGTRITVQGKRLQGDTPAAKWRALWNAASETGYAPRAVHQLRCDTCGVNRRVADLPLRRALTRLAEQGLLSVDLADLPDKM